MTMSEEFKDGRLKLCLSGELDHHGAKEVMNRASERIESLLPRDCVLDLKSVRFMDSSGVALILNLSRRMDRIGGRMRVENVSRQPMKVIDASGIDRIIEIREWKE